MSTIEREIELTEREAIELARVLYFQTTHGFEPKRKSKNREIVLFGNVFEKLLSTFPKLVDMDIDMSMLSPEDSDWTFRVELPRIRKTVENAKKMISCQP